MTTTSESTSRGESERVPAFGRATPAVAIVSILVVSVGSWWLIGDPEWSVVGAKVATPEEAASKSAIVSCVLFWVIMMHIFTGFTFGNWPFSKVRQPLSGLLQVVADIVLGILATLLWTRGVGHWDPTFSATIVGGAGYTAAAFIVLIGFFAYAFLPTAVAGYPFESVEGPLANVGQWLLGAFLTTIGVVTLVYPNFNAQLAPNAPVSLSTAVGWTYSSIVVVIVCGMLLQNAPWAGIANRHLRSVAALSIVLGGGYVVMLILQAVLGLIVPAFVKDAPTYLSEFETAQLGVCIAACALVAGLLMSPSTNKSVAASRGLRTAVVVAAGILIYVALMRFVGVRVLHFPAIDGSYGGNPLLWVNWTILIVLWHSVAFGGTLATRRSRGV
ncbi:hypothetical protein D0Z08_05445 [Nocardioides immobilis]|uniref:Uncharacterized protein n=1 Tax=Nocardioides immobilis TaxID=2049295 RepID=A0A417Y738_9ACTN|nr:hypothetical protein [Nocardioides immobilis]RHW28405.1 hypothetical protein D0Z08_05445 [Nocardioides immobilis]